MQLLQQWTDRFYDKTFVIAVCAAGRAMDLATTWVAIERGRAVESKLLAAQFVAGLGHQWGLIAYEALITTPIIFLGCYLARRLFVSRGAAANAQRLAFYVVGIISVTVAIYNFQFLL